MAIDQGTAWRTYQANIASGMSQGEAYTVLINTLSGQKYTVGQVAAHPFGIEPTAAVLQKSAAHGAYAPAPKPEPQPIPVKQLPQQLTLAQIKESETAKPGELLSFSQAAMQKKQLESPTAQFESAKFYGQAAQRYQETTGMVPGAAPSVQLKPQERIVLGYQPVPQQPTPIQPITPKETIFRPELGYKPITVGSKTYDMRSDIERTSLYPAYKITQDFGKTISENAEKYLIPYVKYTIPGAVRPEETKALARGIVSGAASVPEMFATAGLGYELIARDIVTGKPVKEVGERIGLGLGLTATGLVTSFKEKPIETVGQFIGQSLVFGGIGKGIKEIKIPEIKAPRLSSLEMKYGEVKELPIPKTQIPTRGLYSKEVPTFGSPRNIPTTIRGQSLQAVMERIIPPEKIGLYNPKAVRYEGYNSAGLSGQFYKSRFIPITRDQPIGLYIKEPPFEVKTHLLGKAIPKEFTMPKEIRSEEIIVPKESDVKIRLLEPQEPIIPKIRISEELPEIPKIRITETEAPRGKVFVQRDIGAELKQKWTKTQDKMEKEAKTGGFQVTRQGQIVLMEKPITELRPRQITIQAEKQIPKQISRMRLIEVQKEIKVPRQRQRTIPFIFPIISAKQIAKTALRTRQRLVPKQMTTQRTVSISTQKVDSTLASITSSSAITKQVSATEQISPQILSPVQITKQIQQQEAIQKQIQKQMQNQIQGFEIPQEQILRLKIPSDVTEEFFRRKKKREKKTYKPQKVYAPVLNPLWEVTMKKVAKTKPFKIIDITKKRKRR